MIRFWHLAANTGYKEQIRFECPHCKGVASFFSVTKVKCNHCGRNFGYYPESIWFDNGKERLLYYRKSYHK